MLKDAWLISQKTCKVPLQLTAEDAQAARASSALLRSFASARCRFSRSSLVACACLGSCPCCSATRSCRLLQSEGKLSDLGCHFAGCSSVKVHILQGASFKPKCKPCNSFTASSKSGRGPCLCHRKVQELAVNGFWPTAGQRSTRDGKLPGCEMSSRWAHLWPCQSKWESQLPLPWPKTFWRTMSCPGTAAALPPNLRDPRPKPPRDCFCSQGFV